MSSKGKLILAIESAVNGGSGSIFDQSTGTEIANWVGESKISKSEDILEAVSILLTKYQIEKKSLGSVITTTEVGSLTGLKIGAATAKGLAKGFDCQYWEISLWDVLASLASDQSAKTKVFYLPAGRSRVMRRLWHSSGFKSRAEIISVEQIHFPADFDTSQNTELFIHESLNDVKTSFKNYRHLGNNLATYIARFASDNVKNFHA